MTLEKMEVNGNENIGVYMIATEKYLLAPPSIDNKSLGIIKNILKVDKVIITTIGGMEILGVLATGNSRGIILPNIVREEELEKIQEANIQTIILDDRVTALGNLILINDNGALVSSEIRERSIRFIERELGIKIYKGTIAKHSLVGSFGVATNKGALTHPLILEEEIKNIEQCLDVEVSAGTVNEGVPYIATGLIANSKGGIVGIKTTGPELMNIELVLDI